MLSYFELSYKLNRQLSSRQITKELADLYPRMNLLRHGF